MTVSGEMTLFVKVEKWTLTFLTRSKAFRVPSKSKFSMKMYTSQPITALLESKAEL